MERLILHIPAGFSVGRACRHTPKHSHAPNGAIDHVSGKSIFPLKRAMSHVGVHTRKLCRQNDFRFKAYLVTL